MQKACVVCGKMYTVRGDRKTTSRFCSRKCCGQEKRKLKPVVRCLGCGEEFPAYRESLKFCSRRCSGKYIAAQEHVSKASSERMRQLNKRPDVQEKLFKHLHGPTNPFRGVKKSFREKTKKLLATRGWEKLNGGNGRDLPRPQQILAHALGWPTEVVVLTKILRRSYPTHYKLDIASLDKKIAIEVDGNSHQHPTIQQRDARKDDFLREQGWIVLRFKNKEILNDLDHVLVQVNECLTSKL